MNKWIKYAGFLYLALLAVQIFNLKSTGARPANGSLLPAGVWTWIETLFKPAIPTTPAIPTAPATSEPSAAAPPTVLGPFTNIVRDAAGRMVSYDYVGFE